MIRNCIFLIIFAFSLLLSLPADAEAGRVTGIMLMIDGRPMAGGRAIFFDARHGKPLEPEGEFRPPDMTIPLDDEGRFEGNLPAGDYYFGAVQWRESVGPKFREPLPGDNFFINRKKTITVPEEGLLNIGIYHEGKPLNSSL